MKKIVLDTDYAEVSHNASLQLGKIVWKRKTSIEEYKNAFITLMDFAEKHTTFFFLSDITKQSVVPPEGRKWFETVMLPLAKKNGLKKAGVITDNNVFKKYYLNLIIKTINKFDIPLKIFSSEEEALEWFKK
jgi:hypothetical protein